MSSIFCFVNCAMGSGEDRCQFFYAVFEFFCVGSPSFLVISAPSENVLSVDVIVSFVAFA